MAINNLMDSESCQSLPWYRYAWPWFLISIPCVSVALGSVMLYLALNANNSMVVDDYYKQGKAINLRIERDRNTALLGLQARMDTARPTLIVELDRLAPELPEQLRTSAVALGSEFSLPDKLALRWVHVTQERRDGVAELQFIGANRYVANDVQLPLQGKFRIHLQPLEGVSWRLVSDLIDFTADQSYLIPAPLPEEVYGRTYFE